MSFSFRPASSMLTVGAFIGAALLAPSHAARGQDSVKAAARIRDAYLANMDSLHTKVMALASAIPADKYSWRPSAGARSISEALMYVAAEWYYYIPIAFGGNPPAGFGAPTQGVPALEKITTKENVIVELQKAWTHGRKEIVSADPMKLRTRYKPSNLAINKATLVMADDLHENLDQLVVYARSVGVKAPWAK